MTHNSALLKIRTLSPLLVVAAGLLAYHNSFKGAFVHDDFGSIAQNPTIRHLWPIGPCLSPPHRDGITVGGRPLINLSLAVNYALGGLQVWGYHALNLTVHILAGLTLLGIMRRTFLQPALRERFGAAANELALATAVLWTVHPLTTEAVTYVIQRAESIMGLFYLLTLYCFIRGTGSERSRVWYGLSVAACALGMASKEVMASAPVMVLLYDRTFLSGSFREAWRRRWPLYLALAGTWILLGVVLVSGQLPTTLIIARRLGYSWWEYLATEPGVILYYLRLSVWPSPLCVCHPWPIVKTWSSVLPPAIVVMILLGASGWAWRTRPVWGFVGAWFFLILAPTSSVIPLHDLIYEHRMYLSLAAVVSLVVAGLYSLVGKRSFVVFVAMAVGLGFLTSRRNQDYRSEITLWSDTVAKFPDDADPHYKLGVALQRAGRIQGATAQYEQALRINPRTAEAHWNLGNGLREVGKAVEAMGQYEQALRLEPDFAEAHNNLGVALAQAGRLPEAIKHYERAVQIDPSLADAQNNLGTVLLRDGKVEEAIRHYDQAVRIEPDNARAQFNLGVALEQAGKLQQAIGHYEQAAQINPDFARAHVSLGNTLFEAGEFDRAIDQYQQALHIIPDYADAHNNFGGALLRLGRVREAIEHFEQAVHIVPGMVEAHYNLGVALEQDGQIEKAIDQYQQVLRLKPNHVEAQTRLERLQAGR